MRSRRPSGAAESENGCASHQRSRVRKRQVKNWPARAFSRSEAAALDLDRRRRPAPPRARAPRAARARRRARPAAEPEADERAERGDVERGPVGAGGGIADEVGAGRELVAERERDAEVGVEVDEVPRLVAQPPPHGDHRRDDHADQHHEPGGRGDHAGVAAPQPADLGRQRDACRRPCSRRSRASAWATSSVSARRGRSARATRVSRSKPMSRSSSGRRASSSSSTSTR